MKFMLSTVLALSLTALGLAGCDRPAGNSASQGSSADKSSGSASSDGMRSPSGDQNQKSRSTRP